ncbi:MAG: DUF3558 domain-containing protein [Sciscionella sp.]
MSSVKHRLVGAGLAFVAILLVSCSNQTPGAGSSAPLTSVSSSSAANEPDSTDGAGPTSSAHGSLASVDPCSLLTEAQQGQLGITTGGTPSDVGTARGCQWNTSASTLSLDVRNNAGLSQVPADGGAVTETTVGGHRAKKRDSAGACFIFLGVTASSRVDVSGIGNTGPNCSIAQQAAQLIERNLPRS